MLQREKPIIAILKYTHICKHIHEALIAYVHVRMYILQCVYTPAFHEVPLKA